jgi:hypothetical protein
MELSYMTLVLLTIHPSTPIVRILGELRSAFYPSNRRSSEASILRHCPAFSFFNRLLFLCAMFAIVLSHADYYR